MRLVRPVSKHSHREVAEQAEGPSEDMDVDEEKTQAGHMSLCVFWVHTSVLWQCFIFLHKQYV